MAVVIRLQRVGKPHHPHFRVVAVESSRSVRGQALEILGSYDPRAEHAKDKIRVNEERFAHWLKVGAKPSETVRSLMKKPSL